MTVIYTDRKIKQRERKFEGGNNNEIFKPKQRFISSVVLLCSGHNYQIVPLIYNETNRFYQITYKLININAFPLKIAMLISSIC